ncbi:MAG: GMP synthase [Saprospiraceae bacterium]|nr:GMP synthase [Saprospiraceae bacterium]
MIDRVRLAILDMNNGTPNQGMRCIKEIVSRYNEEIEYEVFDVRKEGQMPDLSFDIYISSGGPGSPLLAGEDWEKPFFDLLEDIHKFNKFQSSPTKFMFLICHSFQLACQHFELGTVTKRKSTCFGIHPVHKTKEAYNDVIFSHLPDPYFAVESRDWQVIQPDLSQFEKHGCQLLSLEKLRTHVDFERAIMAIKFSDEIWGTQFHPEADAIGLKAYLELDETKDKIVTQFGEDKYYRTLAQTINPKKIQLTQDTVLPSFLEYCLEQINSTVIS